MIAASACLCGINCKYSGGNNENSHVKSLYKEGKIIPLCPEQLGGLKTPRTPAEISKGELSAEGYPCVCTKDGIDVTKEFIKGAKETLKICKDLNIKYAILKSNSPSCGKNYIYDGIFTGTLTKGNGVTTEMLIKNGVEVFSEEDLEDIIKISKII